VVEAICSNCGAPWPTGQTKCTCGGINKTFQKTVPIEPPISVSLLTTATTTVVKYYPGWIVIYFLVQMVFAAGSYWTTSPWLSVGANHPPNTRDVYSAGPVANSVSIASKRISAGTTARLVQKMIAAREAIRYSVMRRLLLMRDAG